MSNNKQYYTPDISEFHVGFEYERYSELTESWSIKTYNEVPNLDVIRSDIYLRKIRVPYLSVDDIKDLGFEKKPISEGLYYFTTSKVGKLDSYQCINLYFDQKDNRVSIYGQYVGEVEVEFTLFKGYLKNKNELKKVLKQVGVRE